MALSERTPEELIIRLVSRNGGMTQAIDREGLIKVAIDNGIDEDFKKLTKKDIALRIADKIGYLELTKRTKSGVSSYDLREKFGITNDDVKRMAKAGFLTVTGQEEFRMYGKYCHANLYSPFDYFKSQEEFDTWLAEHPKRVVKRKKKQYEYYVSIFGGKKKYTQKQLREYYQIRDDYKLASLFTENTPNEDNFYCNSIGFWEPAEKPNWPFDHQSESGSVYWYTPEGIYRESDHWGRNIASCSWYYDIPYNGEETEYGKQDDTKTFEEPVVGFIRWKDLKAKGQVDYGTGKYKNVLLLYDFKFFLIPQIYQKAEMESKVEKVEITEENADV